MGTLSRALESLCMILTDLNRAIGWKCDDKDATRQNLNVPGLEVDSDDTDIYVYFHKRFSNFLPVDAFIPSV